MDLTQSNARNDDRAQSSYNYYYSLMRWIVEGREKKVEQAQVDIFGFTTKRGWVSEIYCLIDRYGMWVRRNYF